MPHGKGRMVYASSSYIYLGDWNRGQQEGYGTYKHLDGMIYEGNWLNGQKHGFGKEKWADQSNYEGKYKTGAKNGKGSF